MGTWTVDPFASVNLRGTVPPSSNGVTHSPLKYTALTSTSRVAPVTSAGARRLGMRPSVWLLTQPLIASRAAAESPMKSTSPKPERKVFATRCRYACSSE